MRYVKFAMVINLTRHRPSQKCGGILMRGIMDTAKIILVISKRCHGDTLVCSECGAILSKQTRENKYNLDFNISECPSCGLKLERG